MHRTPELRVCPKARGAEERRNGIIISVSGPPAPRTFMLLHRAISLFRFSPFRCVSPLLCSSDVPPKAGEAEKLNRFPADALIAKQVYACPEAEERRCGIRLRSSTPKTCLSLRRSIVFFCSSAPGSCLRPPGFSASPLPAFLHPLFNQRGTHTCIPSCRGWAHPY